MSDGGEPDSVYKDMLGLARAWSPAAIAAPYRLNQPILPGWSLISVTENNSRSPDTERAIVAKASYGRQLGRIIDAVQVLIAERPAGAPGNAAFEALTALAEDIERTKQDAAKARIERLCADLDLLAAADPDEYERQKAALAALLGKA